MLVSITLYARLTGDTTSTDPLLTDALTDAQRMLEDNLGRPLESATRTEEVRVYDIEKTFLFLGGRAYPKATPITSISSPAGVTTNGVEVRGIAGTVFDLITDLREDFPLTTIVYVGGFAAADAAPSGTPIPLPMVLARAIAQAAREVLRQGAGLTAVAAGATSVRVGDVAVAYAKPAVPDEAIRAIFADPRVQTYSRKRRRPVR